MLRMRVEVPLLLMVQHRRTQGVRWLQQTLRALLVRVQQPQESALVNSGVGTDLSPLIAYVFSVHTQA